jgi:hypothetical protein
MDFPSARREAVMSLDSLISIFSNEQSEPSKSPLNAITSFKDGLSTQTIPILFRNALREVAHRLEGISKSPEFRTQAETAITDSVFALRRIHKDLPIDLARQIAVALSTIPGREREAISVELEGPSTERVIGKKLNQITEDAVKAVVSEHIAHGRLDASKFKTIERLTCGSSPESYVDWQRDCKNFLNNLPVAKDTEVIALIGGTVLSSQWEEIVKQSNQLFYDNFAFPPDFSWVVFFFHHDTLEFGRRRG